MILIMIAWPVKQPTDKSTSNPSTATLRAKCEHGFGVWGES